MAQSASRTAGLAASGLVLRGQVGVASAGVSLTALAALNFFLADVRDGLGPFLGVFLQQSGWAPDDIGYVMTIGGIAAMLATTPLGALADSIRAKRAMIALAAALTIAGSLVILLAPTFLSTSVSQIVTGVAGAAIGPALAGVTLGLVGQKGLPRQLGRNEAWNHAGNVGAAALAGWLGYVYGLSAVFLLMAAMAAASIVSVWAIRPGDIDHDVARGLTAGQDAGEAQSALRVLVSSRPLLVLALALALFHLGNAAMLPLLGQQISAAGAVDPAAFTAVTVIVAQLTMIPVALAAARIAESRGYWLLLIVALIALPARGIIAAFVPGVWAALPVQMLDGVAAGLLGVAAPGLVARILQGTGHINAGLGAVMTLQGLGAALSTALAGYVAARAGYGAAFLVLAGAAGAALALLWLGAASLRAAASATPDEASDARLAPPANIG